MMNGENGANGSCLGDLRSHLSAAQEALADERKRVRQSWLLRRLLGKFYLARLEDCWAALGAARSQLDALGNGKLLVRCKDGKIRKWEATCDE